MRHARMFISWLDSLESGDVFRKISSTCLKISSIFTFAIFLGLGIIVIVVFKHSTAGLMSGVLILNFGLMVGLLYRDRAKKVLELKGVSHLIFTPIVGTMIRLTGEILSLASIHFGVWFLLLSILLPTGVGSALGTQWLLSTPPVVMMILGFALFLVSIMASMFFLVAFYSIAEFSLLIGDITTNVKIIETKMKNSEDSD